MVEIWSKLETKRMLYQKMTIEIQIETKRMLYKEMTNDNVWNSNRYKMFGNY
jgi:hypothetical protein